MSSRQLFAGVTIGAAVAYLIFATLDAKFGVTYKLAQKLPS